MPTEFIEIRPVGPVELTVALIFGGGVVVGDSFAAGVVVSTEDVAGNSLRPPGINGVLKGSAGIAGWRRGLEHVDRKTKQRQCEGGEAFGDRGRVVHILSLLDRDA